MHSSEHAIQISPHNASSVETDSEFRARKLAVSEQISAQSVSSSMHRAIIETSSSFRHSAMHRLHSTTQAINLLIKISFATAM
jgi:hypothetical protein